MSNRFAIVGITAFAAFWLYIDRVCFGTLADPMKQELLLPTAPEPDADVKLSKAEIEAAQKRKREAVKKQKLKERPELGEDVQLADAEVQLTDADIVAAKKKKWSDEKMAFALGAFFLTYALFQIPMGTLADRFGARKVLALSIAAWSFVTMLTGFANGFVAILCIRLMLGVTEAGAYPAAAGLIKSWVPQEQRGRFSSMVAFGGRVGGVVAGKLTTGLAGLLVGVALVEWLISTSPVPPGPDGKPPNWRGVFVVYGMCGLAVALAFWVIVRDRPPRAAALAPTDSETPAPATPSGGEAPVSPPAPRPDHTFWQQIKLFARTRNMWLFGGVQFGVNLGWAFLVTLLPTYLNEAFGVPLDEIGTMQSTALAIGCLGMIFGGVTTDWLRKQLGPKLGRSVPIAGTLSACAVTFLVAPGLPSAWAVIIALGLMAFFVDMHNPSIWSFAQDVGGRKVGAALGWGNMWGNLGAALSPVALNAIQAQAGWNAAFVFCGCAFAVAAVCGFLLDATKPVDPDDA